VPRDSGAGWDFEDIRDFYLNYLFQVDPVELRSCNSPRYLQLSRVVSGEMMALAFSEWRSPHSNNRGGLVWFFKDLQIGAGWGILDSTGQPKAAYYYLRRCWRSRQVVITDEGLDGLHIHVINETKDLLEGYLELLLLKDQHIVVARRETPVEVSPRSTFSLGSDELLGSFYDVTYSYRFGPPSHDVAVATLYDHDREILGESFHFISHREPAMLPSVNLGTEAKQIDGNQYRVTLLSDRFLQGVNLQAKGFLPVDNYFHLVPGRKKTVQFRQTESPSPRFKASLEALNLPQVEGISLGNSSGT